MPTTDELEAEATRLEHEADYARSVFEKAKRKDIESWTQEQLLEAAGLCGEEEGDDHCWRCYAWMLYTDRQEKLEKERCTHDGTGRIVSGSRILCKDCKDVVGTWVGHV